MRCSSDRGAAASFVSRARSIGRALAGLCLALPARAHDFWIEPDPPAAAPGGRVGLALRVGEFGRGELVVRSEAAIDRFEVWLPDGTRIRLPGQEAHSPAGWLRIRQAGRVLAVYQSTGGSVELEAERFERYLRDEGLEAVIAERARCGESLKPGRERFVRCAKALIAIGADTGGDATRRLGLPLEIVPERDPLLLAGGDELVLTIEQAGRPIEGVLVVLEGGEALRARSDPQGRVRFPLAGDGFRLAHAVGMVRAPAGADHDWESAWASLTFTRLATR